MSRISELFSQVGSMRLSGSPCGGTRRRVWEPVLMFPSAFKTLIALIPKAFWELVLFALYHFTGGESGNILWKQMNLDRGISAPHNLPPKVTMKPCTLLLLLPLIIGGLIPAQSLSTWKASHPTILSLALLRHCLVGCVRIKDNRCGLVL